MPQARDGSKQCSSCRRVYAPPEAGFNVHRGTADGWQNACKPCKASFTRNWKYGMESGEIDRMMVAQRGLCAICGKKPTDLVLDHDHATGNVRALLCRLCNSLLGMCSDDVNVLKRAIDYINTKRK